MEIPSSSVMMGLLLLSTFCVFIMGGMLRQMSHKYFKLHRWACDIGNEVQAIYDASIAANMQLKFPLETPEEVTADITMRLARVEFLIMRVPR